MDLCTKFFPTPQNSAVEDKVSLAETMAIPTEKQREPLEGISTNSPEFRVFHNPLLMNEISKYLDHTDLKSLSETGNLLLGPSRSCSQFIRNTKLNIDETSCTKNLDVLKFDFIPWTTVNLQVRKYETDAYEVIQQVLHHLSMKSLQLDQTDSDYESFYVSNDDSIKPSEDTCFHECETPSKIFPMNACVTQLLLSVQNLKCLKLSLEILVRIENLFDSPNLQLLSTSLDTLHIYAPNRTSDFSSKQLREPTVKGGIRYRGFTHNLESLTALLSGKRLRSFSFQLTIVNQLTGHAFTRTPVGKPNLYLKAVVKLVTQHQNSLEELSLHGEVWSRSDLKAVYCPNLKSLEADANARRRDCTNLAKFIENQPLLRSLSLRITPEILSTSKIVDVVRRKSSSLERLVICWTLVQDSKSREIFDWTFLQRMVRLMDLSISQYQMTRSRHDKRGPVPQLLAHLPLSLQKLQVLSDPQAIRISDPESFQITSNLVKLQSLTLLDISYATNSITDAGLQFICSNMGQLLVLRINLCKTLTDFGITGKRENEEDTGISLTTLTGLQELKVVNCKNINFPSLLSVLAFKHLKGLDISVPMNLRDVQTPSAQILKILTQNPLLEEMRLGKHHNNNIRAKRLRIYSNESIKAAVQEFRPRFKELLIYG